MRLIAILLCAMGIGRVMGLTFIPRPLEQGDYVMFGATIAAALYLLLWPVRGKTAA